MGELREVLQKLVDGLDGQVVAVREVDPLERAARKERVDRRVRQVRDLPILG